MARSIARTTGVGRLVVLQGRGALEGGGDPELTDGAVVGGDHEVLERLLGAVDLLGVEDRVTVRSRDPVVLDGRGAAVQLLEAVLGGSGVRRLVVLVDQEERERAGGGGPLGADAEVVARCVRGLHHRGRDDLGDRDVLARTRAVAVVGQRGLRRQDDRVDHEQREQQDPGHEVLRGQGPAGGVGRGEDQGDHPDRGEEEPSGHLRRAPGSARSPCRSRCRGTAP